MNCRRRDIIPLESGNFPLTLCVIISLSADVWCTRCCVFGDLSRAAGLARTAEMTKRKMRAAYFASAVGLGFSWRQTRALFFRLLQMKMNDVSYAQHLPFFSVI
jgi:hypothetical protein